MIASCWDWPSLKYAYFILEDTPLDAGGWSATKGIVAQGKSDIGGKVVSFDECLPSLPKKSFFAGVGDFCVGELFEKRDAQPRKRIDLNAMKSEGTPMEVKAVELLEGVSNSVLTGLRENGKLGGVHQQHHLGQVDKDLDLNYYPTEASMWEKLIPIFASMGIGYSIYRTFTSVTKSDLELRDVLLAWGAGVTIGITIGQEATRQQILRRG